MTTSTLRLLTWNIQSGRGCDGLIAVERIIQQIKSMGPLEVICLQEVARHFDEYVSASQPDQLEALCEAFSDYTPIWGAALSWPGATASQRREFGNLTLVKVPLLDQRVHCLPMRGSRYSADAWQTPRCAVETLIDWRGPMRILNTHLAYHDADERLAQLHYLNARCDAWQHQVTKPSKQGPGIYAQPFGTQATLLCGDLNLDSRSDQHALLEQQGWQDAFQLCHPQQPHTPTCGIHDSVQWPEGPHCRDFVWLKQLTPSSLEVDTVTQLSDHQPLIVTLEPPVHDTP